MPNTGSSLQESTLQACLAGAKPALTCSIPAQQCRASQGGESSHLLHCHHFTTTRANSSCSSFSLRKLMACALQSLRHTFNSARQAPVAALWKVASSVLPTRGGGIIAGVGLHSVFKSVHVSCFLNSYNLLWCIGELG